MMLMKMVTDRMARFQIAMTMMMKMTTAQTVELIVLEDESVFPNLSGLVPVFFLPPPMRTGAGGGRLVPGEL